MSLNRQLSELPTSCTLFEAFQSRVAVSPKSLAWISANPIETRPHWTWLDLQEGVLRAAATLQVSGVAAGDRVVNLGKNCAEWAILDLACAAIGAIHAPIDSRYPVSWIVACLTQLEPRLVCGERQNASPLLEAIPSLQELVASPTRTTYLPLPDGDPAQTASILFTSGTTSKPRGVMLSHRNLLSNAAAKLDAMPQSPDDLRLNLLPFSHAYARTCELTAWILAGGVMACAHGIDAALMHASRLRPQLINAVPAFYDELMRRTQSVSSQSSMICDLLGGRIRRLASGGAPLSDPCRRIFADAGLPVFQGYGLTEASPVVCSNRASEDGNPILSGVGPPVQGVHVRIDEDRRLWVSGDGVMQGYWRDPEATAARIEDGWLDTRDIASIEGTGSQATLRIEGRWDDVQVLANGYKFSPRLIEDRLVSEMKSVAHCVLLGNGRRAPILAVHLAAGCEQVSGTKLLTEIKAILSELPRHAVPESVWISPETWTVENGYLHWKGSPNRKAIQQRIESARIE